MMFGDTHYCKHEKYHSEVRLMQCLRVYQEGDRYHVLKSLYKTVQHLSQLPLAKSLIHDVQQHRCFDPTSPLHSDFFAIMSATHV